jgi:hypothetical protein
MGARERFLSVVRIAIKEQSATLQNVHFFFAKLNVNRSPRSGPTVGPVCCHPHIPLLDDYGPPLAAQSGIGDELAVTAS